MALRAAVHSFKPLLSPSSDPLTCYVRVHVSQYIRPHSIVLGISVHIGYSPTFLLSHISSRLVDPHTYVLPHTSPCMHSHPYVLALTFSLIRPHTSVLTHPSSHKRPHTYVLTRISSAKACAGTATRPAIGSRTAPKTRAAFATRPYSPQPCRT